MRKPPQKAERLRLVLPCPAHLGWGGRWDGQAVAFSHFLAPQRTAGWKEHQETGLEGGRCPGGTSEEVFRVSWSHEYWIHLPVPGNVQSLMMDGLHSGAEQPTLFVCLCCASLQNDSWDQCMLWVCLARKVGLFGLICSSFQRRKEMGVSEGPQAWMPFGKPSLWAFEEFWKLQAAAAICVLFPSWLCSNNNMCDIIF